MVEIRKENLSLVSTILHILCIFCTFKMRNFGNRKSFCDNICEFSTLFRFVLRIFNLFLNNQPATVTFAFWKGWKRGANETAVKNVASVAIKCIYTKDKNKERSGLKYEQKTVTKDNLLWNVRVRNNLTNALN